MTTCARCKAPLCISSIHLFKRLTSQQQALIVSHVERFFIPKGTLVLNQGDLIDRFYIVNGGRFKAYTVNEEGKMHVLYYWSVGSFFGQDALFESTQFPYTIEAMEDSTLCTLTSETMKKLMVDYPDVAWAVLGELSHRLNRLEVELSQVAIEPLDHRLLSLLWTLEKDHGQSHPQGSILHSPLTQEELAMRLGASRESVNRALKKLELDQKLKTIKPREWLLYKM